MATVLDNFTDIVEERITQAHRPNVRVYMEVFEPDSSEVAYVRELCSLDPERAMYSPSTGNYIGTLMASALLEMKLYLPSILLDPEPHVPTKW